MNAETNQGYPREWFVETYVDGSDFICGICQDVLNNPKGCKNGHYFCLDCITRALETHRRCPECKVAVKPSLLANGRLLTSIIEKLPVKCCHASCTWTGPLSSKEFHLNNQCDFELMPPCPLYRAGCCAVEGCKGEVSRKNWSDHIFVSKESSVDRICSLAEEIISLRDEKQVLCTELNGLKKEINGLTKQNQMKQVGMDKLKKEYQTLENKILPNYESKMIDRGTTYSGTLPISAEDFKHSGLLTFWSGNVYHGEMVNYIPDGEGIEKQANGFFFAGSWVAGQFTGVGMKKYKSGDLLVGNFKNKVANGNAKWTSADGLSTYEGEYVNGERHGSGTYRTTTHSFHGQFARDVCHGRGAQAFHGDGHTVSGEWQFGERVGVATYTWPRGEARWKFEGVFNGDDVTGHGVLTFADGRVFTGEVVDGALHGAGSLMYLDGTVETGVWQHNEKLSAEEEALYRLPPAVAAFK